MKVKLEERVLIIPKKWLLTIITYKSKKGLQMQSL
jgi:hypothetical protein